MIKDIVLNLPVDRTEAPATPFAVTLAALFQAHLAGVGFQFEPTMPPVDMGASLSARFLEQARTEARAHADAAIARFEELARREGISAESHRFDTTTASAPARFADIARRFDLAVVQQIEPDQDAMDEIIAESALFESGRPILLVPYIQKGGLALNRVSVCWDGSRAAARAAADAMPFLKRAKTVDLIVIENDRPKSEDFPGIDIAQHLARHDLKVDLKRLPMATDVSATILNFAADAATDLIVMGGYGHSRLREFVLGGATRGIMKSMTVPTLMSH